MAFSKSALSSCRTPSRTHRAARLLGSLTAVLALSACAPTDSVAPKTDPNAPGEPTRILTSTTSVNLGAIGGSSTITAQLFDAKGRPVPQATVTWSSSDITIADVSGSGSAGVVTARAPGRAIIKVAAGPVFLEIPVHVTVARAISLAPTAVTLRAGDVFTFRPSVDADIGAAPELRWSTDNSSIATVAATGVLTGVTPGTTLVRVSVLGDPRLTATSLVTITAPRSVAIQPAAVTTWVGDRNTLRATVDVDSAQSRQVTWSSGDPNIASVTADGVITAIATGSTRIRAVSVADPKARDSVTVQVLPERKVVISPATASFGAGQTRSLSATVSIENGLSREVTWRSADPSVAMVATNGVVTGVAQGTTTITAIAVADTTRRGTATVQIVPIARDIDVQPAALSLFMGDARALTATVSADSGASRGVQWRTSNAAIATVSATGTVTGIAPGTAIVTAVSLQDTTMRAQSLVTVRRAVVVSLTPTSLSLNPGNTGTLAASVDAEAGVPTGVTWRSDSPEVATVDAAGRVTAVAAGSTIVRAISVADTTRRAQATVLVIPAVRTVTVTPSTAVVAPTETFTMSAAVTGDPGVSSAVIWRSSDASIASISGTGVVTGVRTGSVTITAIAAGDTLKRGTASLSVRMVPIVTVAPANINLAFGQQLGVTATVQADSGVSRAVTWSTADASIATVTSGGVITAVGYGSTTITATSVADPTRRGSTLVVVPTQVSSVSVVPSGLALGINGTGQLTAAVSAQGPVSQAVVWRSSAPAVASVSNSGLVTGLTAGTATITALSAADTTKQATATVTVTAGPSRLATAWSTSRLGGALYEDVVSIAPVDASTAFAVNSLGDVYRYSGSTWSLAVRGSTYSTQFLSVSAASGTAMAVGTNGVIARFDGTTWSSMSSGTTATLSSVWLESASSGFAVGANGTALRFTGSWQATSSGSTATLNAVWSSGGTAYAVGNGGEILRYNGSWSRMTSGTAQPLYGVTGTSASSVVAVGAVGTVLRFDGSAWSTVPAGNVTNDLFGVATIASTGRSYIASDVGVLQLEGSTLSTTTTPYAPRLLSMALDNGGGVWTSGQRGSVMRLGASWQTLNLVPDLVDVWTASSNAAWAVGEFGTTYRFSGGSWTRVATPTTATLNAVWGTATEAFAGGDNGTMLRWDGTSWTAMNLPASGHVYGLWGTSPTNVYAVTSGGQVARYNGSQWTVVSSAGSALWAIHGSSANDIVATGENGVAMRFNGSTWTAMNATTSGTLAGVFASGGAYLAVGATSNNSGGLAFSSSGGAWQALSTGSPRVLTAIWGPTGNDVYATGEQGTILRYNGTTWSAMTSGTSDLLWSISGAPDGTSGFAVGYNSTLATAIPGSSVIARASLVGGTRPGGSLEPRRGAALVRGPLPEGRARLQRRSR